MDKKNDRPMLSPHACARSRRARVSRILALRPSRTPWLPKAVRSALLAACLCLFAGWSAMGAAAAAGPSKETPEAILKTRYQLVLELVRHTPTYSPPVASRSFAYLAVTAFEAAASGSPRLKSLAGQLNGLAPVPAREPGAVYDEAVVLEAALADATRSFFQNTGPTGQRAITMIARQLGAAAAAGVADDVVARSAAHGRAVAEHVRAWSLTDGGAVVENMGFPLTYAVSREPGRWVPTSLIRQQQAPLLPAWGANRPFAMPTGAACDLPPPPAYDETPGSPFYEEARELHAASARLTAEERAIARFWADDPMLSPTPPGHWISIAVQILEAEGAPLERRLDVLARLGVALADAFIGCWHTKYRYDTVRPVTVIRKLFDPAWEPIMATPPFPEFPSGHSTQSGAAAAVLAAAFGDPYAFTDATHEADGLPARSYPSFRAAAEEAGLSRFHGGIHFRSAVTEGLKQGACIGAHAVRLSTWR
ncbi:vanadium-dependent haloperoxidase [Chthonobacter rhizosphaerae]|uniref:vanadium-dependent haloperoxidase n=1 Tax=Chthonobacter rhizosphaerae TaxID=2735553 RepID=UPI001FE505AC|nr:vanadium-dependent haloperoxidase [Chthonobacter rhizosphaerae]